MKKLTFIEYDYNQKFTSKSAPEESDFHEAFHDAGLKLDKKDIVIDIDDLPKESIKALIETFDIKTQTVWTDRGAHFYFEKTSSNQKPYTGTCPLGFKVEQLTSANRPHGVTVKYKGILRTIENRGLRQELPWIFKTGTKRESYPLLLGFESGSGRNEALFRHKLKIQNKVDPNMCRKVLEFINNHVFAQPMEQSELDTVARETEEEHKETQTVLDPETAAAMEIISDGKPVYWADCVWLWNGTKYINLGDYKDRQMKHYVGTLYPDKNSRFITEVCTQLYTKSSDPKDDNFIVRLQNGSIIKGHFYNASNAEHFTPYYINIPYESETQPVEIVDNYLDAITEGDKEYRDLILEAMAYPLIVEPSKIASISKCFFIRGNGANGKGTMLKVMRKIYGQENCNTISLKQFKDRTFICDLPGKLVNLSDDVEKVPIDDDIGKMIKNISSADNISTRGMYEKSAGTCITAKLFFTTNHDLSTWEKDDAMKRRMLWLPMFNVVEKPDPNFICKLTSPEALLYWTKLIIEAYERLYENNEFTKSEKVEQFTKEYHHSNNKYTLFIEEELQPDNLEYSVIGKKSSEIGKLYRERTGDKFNAKSFHEALKEFGYEYVKTFKEGWHYKKIDDYKTSCKQEC